MPNINLKKLTLVNYRNIASMELEFDGSSKIVGDNRIGKTNTIEALYWLLTDKLLNGSSDISQIKPLSDTKATVEVKAEFDVDGAIITLGKQYAEEWVKTRGTDEMVFKGHTTTYFYNNTKVTTKKAYYNLFNTDFQIDKSFAGIDVLQMLINPLYLGKMGDTSDWTYLRRLIIDLVGDVEDKDVFAISPNIKGIETDLDNNRGRTDMLAKQYRDQLDGVKTDLLGIDAVIMELDKVAKPSESDVEIAKKGIQECDSNIASYKGSYSEDKATTTIDEEILKLKGQIVERKRELLNSTPVNPNEERKRELLKEKEDKNSKFQDLVREKLKLQTRLSELERDLNNKNFEVNKYTNIRLSLIEELKKLDAQINNPEIVTECPYCHRPYDESEIETRKVEVIKQLQIKKAELISTGIENTKKMDAAKDMVLSLESDYENVKTELERLEDALKVLIKEMNDINSEIETIDAIPTIAIDYDSDKKIIELQNQIQEKEKEKIEIRSSIAKRDATVSSMIQEEEDKKAQFQKVIDDFKYWERCQSQRENKLKEKEEKQKLLIALEQKIEMIKIFIKTKLEMLDSHIERVFGDIKFMLIEPQVNGGYSTVCKPYIKGTKTLWKSGSKSEQLTTGVAICEKIKQATNLPNFPYIFDEGGEVSKETFATRFETESQLICVQVKDNIMKPTVVKL